MGKVVSPYNTHVGAIAGALPTLLGFTAALGPEILYSPWAPHALWLFGMQVLWQMPHFYALAWLHKADYIRGGYKMFPLTDTTGLETAAMSKGYLVALCAMPWGLSACGLASWMLPVGAFLPSLMWWRSLRAFETNPNASTCRRFFLGSLSYLVVMLAVFAATARARRYPPVEGDDSKNREENAVVESVEILEPLWRVSMRNVFYDACPHEKFGQYFSGAGKTGCPITGSSAI